MKKWVLGDIVDLYGEKVVIKTIEPREAGGPMYEVEYLDDTEKTWVNDCELKELHE